MFDNIVLVIITLPYPIAREVYDKSIKYLSSAIEGAKIERIDRIQAN
jgi:uncharacterized protein